MKILNLQGHLAPDAAFVYQNLQDATYFYFNVAPQFQAFNNGNWKSLESSLRKLGSKYWTHNVSTILCIELLG